MKKGSATIDFIKKCATVKSASACQLLRQYFTLFMERATLDHSLNSLASVTPPGAQRLNIDLENNIL